MKFQAPHSSNKSAMFFLTSKYWIWTPAEVEKHVPELSWKRSVQTMHLKLGDISFTERVENFN